MFLIKFSLPVPVGASFLKFVYSCHLLTTSPRSLPLADYRHPFLSFYVFIIHFHAFGHKSTPSGKTTFFCRYELSTHLWTVPRLLCLFGSLILLV